MTSKTVLVSTIDSRGGGVSNMTRFVVDVLREAGYLPELAYYKPFSLQPSLSVPLQTLLKRRPDMEFRRNGEGTIENALGAWLPELEFTHYWPTSLWERLMDNASHFVSVSGNAMAALPFALTKRRFLAWVATDLAGDRKDRIASFPLPRRLLDFVVNYPVLARLERRVLQSGEILALSEHTQEVLGQIVQETAQPGIMPMPVDHEFFLPDRKKVRPGRIGFSARLHDPRKNLELLIDVAAKACDEVPELEVFLVGGEPSESIRKLIDRCGLNEHITVVPFLPKDELMSLLQSLDLYVIPSHQEGLCIAALEAMACGCPVVSTRCGGPEEFVLDDETGYLVDFDVADMAGAIKLIVGNRQLRKRFSQNARQLVVERYKRDRCESVFLAAFERNKKIIREEEA